MHTRLAVVAIAAVAIACGPQDLVVEGATEAVQSQSADALSTETLITFKDDWTIAVDGALVKGRKVRVAYDTDRLPGCRGEVDGRPAWSITGYFRQADGSTGSFEAGGHSPSSGTQEPVFDLTASGELAFWFQVTNLWGCSEWDSNFGRNFVLTVHEAPVITFNKDWSETVRGVPGSTQSVTITYDLSRLPTCRQTYNGLPSWDTLAYYRFDGGAAQYKSVTAVSGYMRYGTSVELFIPEGAKTLELWFKNNDRAGCVAWDSDYGRNYRYTLE